MQRRLLGDGWKPRYGRSGFLVFTGLPPRKHTDSPSLRRLLMRHRPIIVGPGLVLLLLGLTHAHESPWPHSLDIFTTADHPIERLGQFRAAHPATTIRIHLIDEIERLEAELSRGLSGEPEHAKREALKRLQDLPNETRDQLRESAEGLALVIQLDVERYPAILFNRQHMVYGITDLSQAVRLYRSWRMKDEP